MDDLAREYAGRAHFLFVYVREAHPDTFPDHPAHTSYEQKFRHARDLQEKWRTPRTILEVSLDGDVHRVWGGMPNMSWMDRPHRPGRVQGRLGLQSGPARRARGRAHLAAAQARQGHRRLVLPRGLLLRANCAPRPRRR